MTGDVVERLRAELDERERTARKWIDRRCDGCGRKVAARGVDGVVKCTQCDPSDLPLSNDHVLRTIQAHRAILDRHGQRAHWCLGTQPGLDRASCPEVRSLASIYFPDDQS